MHRAYVFTQFGGPEHERFLEIPTPLPREGQLLVAVRAAGVNPADIKRRRGLTPLEGLRLPIGLGREIEGTVSAVEPDVSDFTIGDAVFAQVDDSDGSGGFAEFTLVAADRTAHTPRAVSSVAAATLPIAAATAYDALTQIDLDPGQRLLIVGAGGGVGIAAAQIARHHGIEVIGIASAGKSTLIESVGARHVPSGPDAATRVRDYAPNGVDAVLDLVGGSVLSDVAPLARERSRLVSGADAAKVSELGGTTIVRTRSRQVLDAVAELVAARALDPFVRATFPFDRVEGALRLVESGHATGKVVVMMDPV